MSSLQVYAMIAVLLIRYRNATARFWSKVQKTDGCWIWTGCKVKGGYGQFTLAFSEREYVHRFAFETEVRQLADGMNACHSCDVPNCVRPDHLFEGDDAANRADCVTKRRHNHGTRHGSAKLTEDEVKNIRLVALSNRKTAVIYGVDHRTVGRIRTREQWKLIP